MAEFMKVWAVSRNTDLTEGRGREETFAFCQLKATALRKSRGASTQGCDGRVFKVELIRHNDMWCGPVYVEPPTASDKREQERLDAQERAEAKAVAAGLTEEDLDAIRGFSTRKDQR
jgi:hypothetical protein